MNYLVDHSTDERYLILFPSIFKFDNEFGKALVRDSQTEASTAAENPL